MGNGPRHWNFHRFGDRIRHNRRRTFCVLIGDSTSTQYLGGGSGDRAGWAYGITRQLDVDFCQYVGVDWATTGAEGQSGLFTGSGITGPGATLDDGTTVNPMCGSVDESSVTGSGAHSNTLGRCFLQLGSTVPYYRGDWTRGLTMEITRYNTRSTTTWASCCYRAFANGGGGGDTGLVHSANVWPASAGQPGSFTYATFVRDSVSATNIQAEYFNHAAAGPFTSNFYKTRWRGLGTNGLGTTRGFGWAAIGREGWSAAEHVSQYSQAALSHEFATMGYNVVIIQLGLNAAVGENSGDFPTTTYRDNYQAVIDRVKTALVASGVADPLVILQSVWTRAGSPAVNYYNAQNEVVLNLARANDSASIPFAFWSVERSIRHRSGLGDNWYEVNGDGLPYLVDDTHQSVAGANAFAGWMQEEAIESLQATGPMSRGRERRGRGRLVAA